MSSSTGLRVAMCPTIEPFPGNQPPDAPEKVAEFSEIGTAPLRELLENGRINHSGLVSVGSAMYLTMKTTIRGKPRRLISASL
jgi:hypothetical protein